MEAREAAGYPGRSEACRKFGFNVNTMKAHEYGQRTFKPVEAARYAKAFSVSVEYLTDTATIEPERAAQIAPKPDRTVVRTTAYHERPLTDTGAHHGTPTAPPPKQIAPPGAGRGALVRTTRTTCTNPSSTGVGVVGACAYGVWAAPSSTPLYREALVPPAPEFPSEQQYARQALAGSRSGLYVPGDYIICLKFDGGKILRGRHYDVTRRRGGQLLENSVWLSQGSRRLVSDSVGDAPAEEIDLDPDDNFATVEGVVIAIYRPVISAS